MKFIFKKQREFYNSKFLLIFLFLFILVPTLSAWNFESGSTLNINIGGSINDTNASTACAGTEYLAGNGTCLDVSAVGGDTDTNASTACAGAEVFLGNGTCSVGTFLAGAGIDTDTNATTACAGTEILLGNGTCSIGTYLAGTGNASWNQTFADTLYYDLGNSFGFYNVTNPPPGGNASWNQTWADTLYYDLGNSYSYYNSTDFSISDYYLLNNPYGFLNGTNLADDIVWDFANNDFNISFSAPTSDGIHIEGVGAYTGDLVHIHQHTGNPSSTTLLNLHADDPDVLPLNISGTSDNAIITLQNITAGWFIGSVNYSDVQNHPSMTDTNETSAVNVLQDSNFWNDTDNSFNETYADTLYAVLGSGNASWNQTWADTLYYDLGNSFSYYNSTTLTLIDTNATTACDIEEVLDGDNNCINLNDTIDLRDTNISDTDTNASTECIGATMLLGNGTCSAGTFLDSGSETDPFWLSNYTTFNASWGSTFNDSYYLVSNPFSFYNSTNPQPGSNASWNQTWADTLYYDIGNSYSYYNSTNPQTETDPIATSYGYYNSTNPPPGSNASWNQTWADTLYYDIGNSYSYYNSTNPQTEVDPTWTGNWTSFNSSWGSVFNDSYYLVSNPFSFYNLTNPQTETDPICSSYGYYNVTTPQPNTFSYYNLTNHVDANISEDEVEAFIFDDDNTANLNMSAYNISTGSTNNNSRFCMNQDCSSYIYFNGSGILIQG